MSLFENGSLKESLLFWCSLDGFNGISEELQAALLEDKSLLIQETENLSIKDELTALSIAGQHLAIESESHECWIEFY